MDKVTKAVIFTSDGIQHTLISDETSTIYVSEKAIAISIKINGNIECITTFPVFNIIKADVYYETKNDD